MSDQDLSSDVDDDVEDVDEDPSAEVSLFAVVSLAFVSLTGAVRPP